jgi:hypothetical protein
VRVWRGIFFGYLFRSKKNTGWDCNRLTSSKQKGGTWGDDFLLCAVYSCTRSPEVIHEKRLAA